MLFMPIPFVVSCGAFSCFNVLQLLKAYANKASGVQTCMFLFAIVVKHTLDRKFI
jgi:hypothetical protein